MRGDIRGRWAGIRRRLALMSAKTRGQRIQLSIIIVNWNTRIFLGQCLRSIMDTIGDISHEIIVVDNCSPDGSAEMVAQEFPQVRLIANDENLGFARGNNQGIKESKGQYILLLNPDIVVHPQAIEKLLQFLEQRPEAGAVGARLLNPDGSTQRVGFFRRFPSVVQVILFDTALRRLAIRIKGLRERYWEYVDETRAHQVDQIPGACLMTRREVIERIGLLDEDFTFWYEDVDWCYRMRNRGWELYFLPQATMTHFGGQSFAHWSESQQQVQLHKSMLKFFIKHRGFAIARLVKWIVIIDRVLLTALDFLIGPAIDLLTGKDVKMRLERRKALIEWLMKCRLEELTSSTN